MSAASLPLARVHWLFQLIGSSIAVSAAVLLLAAAVAGLASPLYVPLAVLGVAMFAAVFVSSVRGLASDGIAVTEKGFRYIGREYLWSDVADFAPVGFLGKSHVRIVFRPGVALHGQLRLADACGRFGFYHPATHIPIKGFDTGGQPLAAVLNRQLNSR